MAKLKNGVFRDPGNQYPAGGGSSRIYGSAAPGTEISFAFTGGPDSMKLLRDLKAKDKEISMQKDGSNAFVKLLPVTTRANGTIIDSRVNDFNRDVYIECNNKMFSLNFR